VPALRAFGYRDVAFPALTDGLLTSGPSDLKHAEIESKAAQELASLIGGPGSNIARLEALALVLAFSGFERKRNDNSDSDSNANYHTVC
jgi:hypothetical protein